MTIFNKLKLMKERSAYPTGSQYDVLRRFAEHFDAYGRSFTAKEVNTMCVLEKIHVPFLFLREEFAIEEKTEIYQHPIQKYRVPTREEFVEFEASL